MRQSECVAGRREVASVSVTTTRVCRLSRLGSTGRMRLRRQRHHLHGRYHHHRHRRDQYHRRQRNHRRRGHHRYFEHRRHHHRHTVIFKLAAIIPLSSPGRNGETCCFQSKHTFSASILLI